MFSIFSGLKNFICSRPTYYILVIGRYHCGKSTFLKTVVALLNNTSHDYKVFPTSGLNIETIKYGRHVFTFWDLGGDADLIDLWKQYLNCCVLIYCIASDFNSFETRSSLEELDNLLLEKDLQSVPLLLIITKCDIIIKPETTITYKREDRPFKIIKTSSITKNGINSCIQWIANHIDHKL
ncbi:hypothetical protein A3Q56_03131 [Intoshia linei]|uniref:Uncharacterized protein n=1 Tax=Intoshia linei TaxID=1819745 RepID=A0A177B650_9BILA|nr:hypothetical protein A3Q56_03131 [Intoshia linei]